MSGPIPSMMDLGTQAELKLRRIMRTVQEKKEQQARSLKTLETQLQGLVKQKTLYKLPAELREMRLCKEKIKKLQQRIDEIQSGTAYKSFLDEMENLKTFLSKSNMANGVDSNVCGTVASGDTTTTATTATSTSIALNSQASATNPSKAIAFNPFANSQAQPCDGAQQMSHTKDGPRNMENHGASRGGPGKPQPVQPGTEGAHQQSRGKKRRRTDKQKPSTVDNWKHEKQRALLLTRKFGIFEKELAVPTFVKQDYCWTCKISMVYNHANAQMECSRCGQSKETLDATHAAMTYNAEADMTPYAYDRLNHLMDLLEQYKKPTEVVIPQSVYDQIMSIIRMSRNKLYHTTLNVAKVRSFLKQLKLSEYYRNSVQIMYHLNNMPQLVFTEQQEVMIILVFIEMQKPFEKVKPWKRQNFLNYSLVLHKICELLGYTEFVDHLPLLKTPDKLLVQLKVWNKICEELGWPCYDSSGAMASSGSNDTDADADDE